MSFQQTLVDGALKAIATFHPELAPFMQMIIKYEPQIEKLGPVIQAAATEGPGAFAAAEKEAPELAAAIKTFVHSIPLTANSHDESSAALDRHTENVTRQIVGMDKMTPDEESDWIERKTPASVDNSQFGG